MEVLWINQKFHYCGEKCFIDVMHRRLLNATASQERIDNSNIGLTKLYTSHKSSNTFHHFYLLTWYSHTGLSDVFVDQISTFNISKLYIYTYHTSMSVNKIFIYYYKKREFNFFYNKGIKTESLNGLNSILILYLSLSYILILKFFSKKKNSKEKWRKLESLESLESAVES